MLAHRQDHGCADACFCCEVSSDRGSEKGRGQAKSLIQAPKAHSLEPSAKSLNPSAHSREPKAESLKPRAWFQLATS
jgi:hypothetical protein